RRGERGRRALRRGRAARVDRRPPAVRTGEAAKPPPEAPTPVSTPAVHPLALVAPDAQLGPGVAVGPFAVVEPGVSLGAGTLLHAHAVVRTGTCLGAGNVVHPFAVLGGDPQERTYAGEPTTLEIGDKNTFREHVTVHRGSAKGSGVTRIGSHNLLMAGVHVAH